MDEKPQLFRNQRLSGATYSVFANPRLVDEGRHTKGAEVVHLSVSRYPQKANYYYPSENPHYVLAHFQGEHQVYRSPISNYAQNPIPEGALFGHQFEPAHHQVSSLYTTRAGRAMAPGVLGVAALQAKREGMELRPSEDLSPHSSQMVEHLQKRGLVPESASHAVTNDITWMNEYEMNQRPTTERVSTEEWTKGRNYMRQMLGGSKASTPPVHPAMQQLQFNF